LIDALLTLARSDAGAVAGEFVDLATAAEDALDAARGEIAAARLAVRTELAAAETTGDRVLLERLVANLVDNAVRHNVAGGWVSVTTGRAPDGSVRLEVANGGQVVAAASVPTLFEPFGRLRDRLDSARGVGLGLSIVRSVATSHGGTVDAVAAPDGGLTVTVALPSTRDSHGHGASSAGFDRYAKTAGSPPFTQSVST
jgi:signal transduction histidine kinase